MGAHGFRRCFTPLSGCFSPFPHGTGSLSVTGECSALEGGPPCFPPGSSCPEVLWDGAAAARASRTGLSPCAAGLPRPFRCARGFSLRAGSRTPARAAQQPPRGNPPGVRAREGLGQARFRSPLLGISVDFSSSGYLDVSVPPVAPRALCVRARVREHDLSWVPPFGNPRINGRLRLPAAYRSLPRPSSTSRAKASAVRPSYLRSAPRARAGRRPAYIRSVLLKMRPPSRGMEGLCKRSIARYAAVKVRGGAHALAGAGAPEAGCWEAGGLKGPSFGLASP